MNEGAQWEVARQFGRSDRWAVNYLLNLGLGGAAVQQDPAKGCEKGTPTCDDGTFHSV